MNIGAARAPVDPPDSILESQALSLPFTFLRMQAVNTPRSETQLFVYAQKVSHKYFPNPFLRINVIRLIFFLLPIKEVVLIVRCRYIARNGQPIYLLFIVIFTIAPRGVGISIFVD